MTDLGDTLRRIEAEPAAAKIPRIRERKRFGNSL
jgi:hypothetical protein